MTDFNPDTYSPAPDLLQDRVILITGAGSGIGRALAMTCARHGAVVGLLGRTLSKLESLYDEILAEKLAEPFIAQMNLLKAQGPQYFELAASIDAAYGRLDGLVHNAGVLGQMSPIEHHDVGVWSETLHINLTAPFVLTQVLLPLLKRELLLVYYQN